MTQAEYLKRIKRNSWLLERIPESERTEKLCKAAVGKNCYTLQIVPMELRSEALCLVAVKQTCWALQYVPEGLRAEIDRRHLDGV
jgi:hypothetical protein